MNIHTTAIVSKKAEIGKNVYIGPFSFIQDNVVIGEIARYLASATYMAVRLVKIQK